MHANPNPMEMMPAWMHVAPLAPTLVWPALVTFLALLLTFWQAFRVGLARARFHIQPPAIAGNPEFERVFRAHQNMTEQLVLFLPMLWLAALFANAAVAAAIGVLWLLARLWYAVGYPAAAAQRLPGFVVGTSAFGLLALLAIVGIGLQLADRL